jgi:hypothetical protein
MGVSEFLCRSTNSISSSLKPLQITAIHAAIESGFGTAGKGVGNYGGVNTNTRNY